MKLSVIGGLTQAEGEALGAFTSSGDLGVHGGMLENGPHLACSACVAPRPHSSAPLLPQLPGTGGVRLHMSPSRPTSTTPRPFLMTLPSVSLADHASLAHAHTHACTVQHESVPAHSPGRASDAPGACMQDRTRRRRRSACRRSHRGSTSSSWSACTPAGCSGSTST